MDDGIELNFAPPGAGGIAVGSRKKGGRWTDRVKQKRDIKRKVRTGAGSQQQTEPIASRSSGPVSVSVQAPAPSSAPAGTSAPRPAHPSIAPSELATSAISHQAPPGHAGPSSSGRPKSHASTNHSGPALQIVSSLFTSNPRPLSHLPSTEEDGGALDDAGRVGEPSNAPLDTSTFDGLGLDPLITRHLRTKMGIDRPTSIQRAALSRLLDPTPLTSTTVRRRHLDDKAITDAFIQSQTGSGKTLAYILPIVQSLLPIASAIQDAGGGYVDRSVGTLAIVLVPTRELARQISEVVERLLALSLARDDEAGEDDDEDDTLKPHKSRQAYRRYLVTGLLTGGQTMTHEKSRLRKGCPILIATPGRLLDHLQNTQSFRVEKLMWLVLDEADRLMESGFGEVLRGIVRALDGRRKLGLEAAMVAARGGKREGARVDKRKGGAGGYGNAWEEDGEDEDDEDGGDDYEMLGAMRAAQATGVKERPRGDGPDNVDPSWPHWSLGRRTILCSATVSQDVKDLAGVALKDPVWFRGGDEAEEDAAQPNGDELVISAASKSSKEVAAPAEEKEYSFTPPSQLSQKYAVVPLKLRLVTLVALLRSLINKDKKAKLAASMIPNQPVQGIKIIVFLSCTDSVDFHWKMFGGIRMAAGPPKDGEGADGGKGGEDADEPISYTSPLLPNTAIYHLHGSLPLATRQRSLKAFGASSVNPSILLCTSVASRGLDLPLVRAVIQYDLPTEQGVNEYVHRVGRTARVGKGGESWAFVSAGTEEGWVDWVEKGMNEKSRKEEDGKVARLNPVPVEQVLRSGFGGKGVEYEARATQVQLAFERWVLEQDENTALARTAFQSYVRAYSTHPSEEKKFFSVRSLHLGHLAKCFGLREAPGRIGAAAGATNASAVAAAAGKKRKRSEQANGATETEDGNDAPVEHLRGEKSARNSVEMRMYEAVRKQGRLTKVGGMMGEFASAGDGKKQKTGFGVDPSKLAGGGGDYQVVGGGDLEKLVAGKRR